MGLRAFFLAWPGGAMDYNRATRVGCLVTEGVDPPLTPKGVWSLGTDRAHGTLSLKLAGRRER